MDQLGRKYHDLFFGVRRSIRYHTRRRAFFDTCHTVVNFIGVVFGSATILGVLGTMGQGWTIGAAVIVTVSSALDLVIGTAGKARVHHDLARRFIELEKQMLVGEQSEENLVRFTNERLTIEADEPPVKRVLDLLCHNEQARAEGYDPKHFVKVPFYQRWLAQFVDIGQDNLPSSPKTT